MCWGLGRLGVDLLNLPADAGRQVVDLLNR